MSHFCLTEAIEPLRINKRRPVHARADGTPRGCHTRTQFLTEKRECSPEAYPTGCDECNAEVEACSFRRRLRLFSRHVDHCLTSCVFFRYLERWDKIRGWCAYHYLNTLASVNTRFAQGVTSVDERSLAHIGKDETRRMSVESMGNARRMGIDSRDPARARVGPVSARVGVCKGLHHVGMNVSPDWEIAAGGHCEHTDSELHELCPCGYCLECSLHTPSHSYPKLCTCAVDMYSEGILWTVENHRVVELEGGELTLSTVKEYFYSIRNSIQSSTQLVRFRVEQS